MRKPIGCLVLDPEVETVDDLRKTRTTQKEFARFVEVWECSTDHPCQDG
jgi:hypothetical protein